MSNINSAIIEGIIDHIGAVEQITDKFRTRTVVVKVDGVYPKHIPVQFINANVDKADSLKLGDFVSIQCNLQGREHNGRWFPSITAWRVDLKAAQPVNPTPSIGQQPTASAPVATSTRTTASTEDDLPF